MLVFKRFCVLFLFLVFLVPAAYPKVAKELKIPVKRNFPINKKVNPCHNFYKYTCSELVENFKLPDDRSSYQFSISDAMERLLRFKKKYFLNLAKKKPKSTMEKEIKTYYLSCMDKESAIKEEKEFVVKTKALMEKIATREQFLNLIADNITNASGLSFISFVADEPNLDNPRYNDLFFMINLRSLPEKSYYEDAKLVADLKLLIKDFFITIGEKNPEQKAEMVVAFEKELAELYPLPEVINDRFSQRTKISRAELINDYPYLLLKKFLFKIPKHVVIRNIISNKPMKFLNKKLKKGSLEELKSIYLYFQLRGILDDAYPDFFNKKFKFAQKYLGAPNQRPDREERCTFTVMYRFDNEVDYILLPKLFPNFPKQKFVNSIEKIRGSLLRQLRKNRWLNPASKKEAIRKVQTAKFMLVSPDRLEDWDFNPRTDYAIDKPIANSHKLSQLLLERELKELNGPVNTNRWQMSPLTMNAYCQFNYNQIVFPVGILQYPFYDPKEPEEINLGAIGAVIGHELGHLVDDKGSRYNAAGQLKAWMNTRDQALFDKKSRKLVSQFNQIGHNGILTLGENIGDLVGLTTAYQAAFPDKKKGSVDLKKRFFLQYARIWCELQKDKFAEMRFKTDPHSLGFARVNEQVKHQPGFKEAYKCKPTDPMVLPEEDIVRIW